MITFKHLCSAFVAAILLLVAVGGCGSGDVSNEALQHRAEWVSQADRLCDRATARLEQIPPAYIATYGDVVPVIARNERALAAKLRALEVPKQDRSSIERLAGLLARQSGEVDAAAFAYTHLENASSYDDYKRHVKRARALDGEIETAARSLGADACAHPPARTRYL